MLRLKLIQYWYENQLHHLKINYTEQKEQSTWLFFAIFHPKTFVVDRNLLWMMRTIAMKFSLIISCMLVKRRLLFRRSQPTIGIRLLCQHFWHFFLFTIYTMFLCEFCTANTIGRISGCFFSPFPSRYGRWILVYIWSYDYEFFSLILKMLCMGRAWTEPWFAFDCNIDRRACGAECNAYSSLEAWIDTRHHRWQLLTSFYPQFIFTRTPL